MRTFPVLGALALALTACSNKPAPAPAASAVAAAPTPPLPSGEILAPAASTPASSPAVAASSPALILLPPAPTNPAPIRDCDSMGADADCRVTIERTTKNRSIAECKKIDALPGYSGAPTAFARGFHTAIEGCFQGAMVRELDRRLVPLKSVDGKAFHAEMALQKAFNEAVRATCDEVLVHEQSTSDFRGEFRCTTFLVELRTHQAENVNAGGLETTHAPAVKVARARRFKAFATQLCALAGLWRGAPPEACEARILGELEDTLAGAARF